MLWLQSERWYADIRTPSSEAGPRIDGPETAFARAWAFAGTAIWEEPVMTWTHTSTPSPTRGWTATGWRSIGDVAIETGVIEWDGRFLPFCEEWQRISPAGAAMSAEVDTESIETS